MQTHDPDTPVRVIFALYGAGAAFASPATAPVMESRAGTSPSETVAAASRKRVGTMSGQRP